MKKYFLLFIPLILLSVQNCKEDNSVTPSSFQKYPDSIGIEWEYNSVVINQLYDSTIISGMPDTINLGNTIVRVVDNDDSLSNYKYLIRFETYDINSAMNKSYHWYSNSDDGLIAIAYMNAGASQPIVPKLSEKRYLTFEEIKWIFNTSGLNLITTPSTSYSDSILFYEVPRKALAYPLVLNKRWTELTYPWHRDKYVNRIVNINFNGQSIQCYEIKAIWQEFNIEFNDFVSLQYGLVKREFIADSVLFSDPSNPDSGDYGKVHQFSNLLRFRK